MIMYIIGLLWGSLNSNFKNSFFLSLSLGLISHVPRLQVSMTANIKSLAAVISAVSTKLSLLYFNLDPLAS